jgi:hypothetical protein
VEEARAAGHGEGRVGVFNERGHRALILDGCAGELPPVSDLGLRIIDNSGFPGNFGFPPARGREGVFWENEG